MLVSAPVVLGLMSYFRLGVDLFPNVDFPVCAVTTTLPGARVEDFERLFELMEAQGISHVRVTAGGFLDEESVEKIKKLGVLDFYPKGSIYLKMEQWSREFGETTQPIQYHKSK